MSVLLKRESGRVVGMTITEKILAKAAGREAVVVGELVGAKIDVVMCVDVAAPPALAMFAQAA